MNLTIEKKAIFTGHRDCVYSILSDKNENYFYSVAGDGMVVRWNIQNPEEGELMAKFPNSVYAFHYVETENKLIVGQNFEGIHLIDLEQKKELKSLKLTDSYIFDIKVWEEHIFVACGDGKLHIVDFKLFTVKKTLQFSPKSARCLAINPQLKELAVGSSDNKIRIISLKDFKIIQTIDAHSISVFSVCYTPDFKYLVSGSRDAHLKFWDCWNHYSLDDDIVAHMYTINHVAYSPTGQFFATCSMDKSIKIWDSETNKLLKVIDKSRYAGHATSVNRLAWLSNSHLLSCSDDKKISLWEIR